MHLKDYLKMVCVLGMALGMLGAAGCGETETGTEEAEQVGTLTGGTGKADGIEYEIKDFFKTNKWLPLNDLVGRLAELATDKLNDQLADVPFVDIKLAETELYSAEAESIDMVETKGLKQLHTSLTQRFGATDFATLVNAVRLNHLQSSDDKVFAESEFSLSVGDHGVFQFLTEDLPATLGFWPNQLITSRVVVAYPGSVSALLQAPLEAVKSTRGFVLPRSVDDVVDMKPGESVALVGKGDLAINVGANIPIFAFDPISYLTISTRFSLGAKVHFSGTLDCQVIRGAGDIAYLEVGIKDWSMKAVRVALEDGWGLMAIPDFVSISVLGKTFTLGDVAEKAATNFLRKKGWLSAGVEYSASSTKSRITIDRFKFDLSSRGEELDRALEQGISGDLRLAQTLSDRSGSGVEELISFARDLNQTRTFVGAHVSSMRFFSQETETAGSVIIEDEAGMQEILLHQMQQSKGKFWGTWGYRRLLIHSQRWADGKLAGATSNLRLAVSEADSFTERDQVLDHVDAALLTFLSFEELYGSLTEEFEKLQHKVDTHCEECDDEGGDPWCEDKYEECIDSLLSEEEVEAWKAKLEYMSGQTVSMVDDAGWDSEFMLPAEIVGQLLDVKLSLSAVKEFVAGFSDTTGRTSILTDQRFSMDGIDMLFQTDPIFFQERLAQVLVLIVSKRSKPSEDKYESAEHRIQDDIKKLDAMMAKYEEIRAAYLQLDEITKVTVEGQAIADGAFILMPASDEAGDLTLRSIAEQKGLLAARLFDELIVIADDYDVLDWLQELFTLGLAEPLGFESHHWVSYTMLSLVPPEERELLFSMDFEEEAFNDVHAYGRGQDAELIGAGQFDLEQLLQP